MGIYKDYAVDTCEVADDADADEITDAIVTQGLMHAEVIENLISRIETLETNARAQNA